jgi:hypothetical protein
MRPDQIEAIAKYERAIAHAEQSDAKGWAAILKRRLETLRREMAEEERRQSEEAECS